MDMGDTYPIYCNLDGICNYPSKRVLETPFQRHLQFGVACYHLFFQQDSSTGPERGNGAWKENIWDEESSVYAAR